MYLLTKKMKENSVEREKLFLDLIKTDYSEVAIYNYKKFKESEILKKAHQKINLGYEIRSVLVALTVVAAEKGYTVNSAVTGWGSFVCNTEYIKYSVCDAVIKAVKSSLNKRVKITVNISKNSISIKIYFKCNHIPDVYGDFKAIKAKNSLCLMFIQGLIPTVFKDFTEAWFFICDKLSPVNLAFLN